jgi:hypothetical protein
VGTPAASPDQTSGADAGTITVSPGAVSATDPGSLTFTYWAPAGGVTPTGEVTLVVPDGWTPPSAVPGAAGYTTSQPDPLQMSGMRITITGITLSPRQPLTITYRPTAAPRVASRWVFLTSERSAATSALTSLAVSPAVLVSLSSPLHIPVPLVAALLAAGLAVVAAGGRFLRHQMAGRRQSARHRRPAIPDAGLRTVPHTGPPGQVSVQPTRGAATHTLAIQPVFVPRVTTIEETPSEETPT